MLQTRLHALAGAAAPQALAVNTSVTYLGVALGEAVGGVLLSAFGPAVLPMASGLLGVVALLLIAFPRHPADRPLTHLSTAEPPAHAVAAGSPR